MLPFVFCIVKISNIRFWHRADILTLPCPGHLNLALTNVVVAKLRCPSRAADVFLDCYAVILDLPLYFQTPDIT